MEVGTGLHCAKGISTKSYHAILSDGLKPYVRARRRGGDDSYLNNNAKLNKEQILLLIDAAARE